MSRKISLPVSAHECAASATIDAEPVRVAAIVLAIAMTRLAAKARMTVNRLSPPPLPSSSGREEAGVSATRSSVLAAATTASGRGRSGAGSADGTERP